MEHTIRFIPGEPRFDSLEVIKLRCDPSIDINSRLYGQAQLGRSERFFYARVWSFETAPAPEGRLTVTLKHGGHTVTLQAGFDKSSSLTVDSADRSDLLTAYLIGGEDLQGEYWGAVMMMPSDELLVALGLTERELPCALSGNILREHPLLSSAAPAEEGAVFILKPAVAP